MNFDKRAKPTLSISIIRLNRDKSEQERIARLSGELPEQSVGSPGCVVTSSWLRVETGEMGTGSLASNYNISRALLISA